MGNIQDLLAQILSARYGRDVRQSIHDAIRQCYDDGHAGAIDLQARTLLGDADISGISETVTGAVVELDGAVGTAQTTADGAQTTAEAKLSPADAWKVAKTTATFTNVTVAANGAGYSFNVPLPDGISGPIALQARSTSQQPLTVTSMYVSSSLGAFVVRLNNISTAALTLDSIIIEVTYAYK